MNDATRLQALAADPASSTWLSANAGSGKTRVLTDRVARLLLAGTPPENILCLTYTKAAASEMQNRLFRRLGAWAMMPEAELRQALDRLGVEDHIDLPAARRLFARAIEAPGGLRIQTIHSFCASLLRRFPLEAGVSPRFAEMEELAQKELLDEILEEMAEGPDGDLVSDLARYLSGDPADLAMEVAKKRDRLTEGVDEADLRVALGLSESDSVESMLADVFRNDTGDIFDALETAIAEVGTDAQRRDGSPFTGMAAPWSAVDLRVIEGKLLYGAKVEKSVPFTAKVGKYPTGKARGAMGSAAEDLDDLMERVEAARDTRLGLATLERSLALHRFAAAFLPRYEAAKQTRGWLDFDDQILRARNLLTDRDAASWVLWKLDGGIDHILVDEAQDTSPAQWQVIRALVDEFAAGHGARGDLLRTLFVVGDKKQSIYSFQGADPRMFDKMGTELGDRLSRVGAFNRRELPYSFRSAPAILNVVDEVLRQQAGANEGSEHLPFHADLPGRVDLWPLHEKETDPDDAPWFDPVDLPPRTDARRVLADSIAGRIAGMIRDGTTIPRYDAEKGLIRRPVTEGDILILVQRRNALFDWIIRACKAKGLKVAGADRFTLTEDLAVRDILAVLSFLATPEDDLSLASALRSPLFGWSEGSLYDLAAGRTGGFLWKALREQDHRHPETLKILQDLRRAADFLRPYELIDRLLTRHSGRPRLLGRLGLEAEDAINQLEIQALTYERAHIPSLTGFLQWLGGDDREIKREVEGAGDAIRVMTVHGAKGLESPVVILPDTVRDSKAPGGDILFANGETPVWKASTSEMPPVVEAAYLNRKAADAEERDQRLLYVAMTRAETWLILCGAGDARIADKSWYGSLERAMNALDSDPLDTPLGRGTRFLTGNWDDAPLVGTASEFAHTAELPDWVDSDAPVPVVTPPVISPSDLGGAKALPGDEAELNTAAAMLRGSRIHALLEHLPPDEPETWRDRSNAILARLGPPPDDLEIQALLAEAGGVLGNPGFADLFGKTALAEVGVAAPYAGGRIIGQIDRLIVTEARILAVDFKTNAMVPENPEDVPLGLLRQMGAYAHALAAIYPERHIDTAILWTRAPSLMPLPGALVADALAGRPAP